MPTFVVLLRGVNVGKSKRVPMAAFRALLGDLGYTGVATLLNSGNAVFRAARGAPAKHAREIARALADELKVEVPVVVKPARELAAAIEDCPLEAGEAEHSRFLVAFAQETRAIQALAPIERLVVAPERFAIGRRAAYLHCPRGILRSRAGEALLGRAGRAVTTRNWATVLKLRALAEEDS